MFEKFAEEGIKAVVLAMEEAFELEHNYCGTEHLLVGIIAGQQGVAANALLSRGLTLENVRKQIDKVTDNKTTHSINRKPFSFKHFRDGSFKSMKISFSPRAKRVIQLAAEIATAERSVNALHLLLGIMKEGSGEGVAGKVLTNFGISFDELQEELENVDF